MATEPLTIGVPVVTSGKVLVLFHKDLEEKYKDLPLMKIRLNHLISNLNNAIVDHDVVLYIDNKSRTKILKNRFGDRGHSLFTEAIESIKTDIDGTINFIKDKYE